MDKKLIFTGLAAVALLLSPPALSTAEAGCGSCAGPAAVKAACGADCTKPCCAAGPKGTAGKKACGPDCTKPCCAGKPAAVTARLAAALDRIDRAHKAIESGDHKAALAALAKARELIRLQHDAAVRKILVNTTCPMSGRAVKTAHTRLYDGKAIGFCGPGCAAAWDKAPAAKRAAVAAKAAALRGAAGPTGPYANVKCPIMGSPIQGKVPAHLVRTYKGRKVAFCCGGCPAAWDKLPDAQKAAKLSAVRAK